MKAVFQIFFTFILLCSNQVCAQGLQYEIGLNDSFSQYVYHIANKNEFSYMIVTYGNSQVYLEKYDTLGVRLQKKQIHGNPSKMIITNDGNIWISSYSGICSSISTNSRSILVFDSNCQSINQYVNDYGTISPGNVGYVGLSAISDTSVAAAYFNSDNDSSWIEIFSTTTQTSLQNQQTPYLSGFAKNDQFYLIGYNDNKIYGIDNLGVFQDSISVPATLWDVKVWNDTIIAMGGNNLVKITPDLQTFTNHSFNVYNHRRLKVDTNGVRFISGLLVNSGNGVHSVNHNLDPSTFTTIPINAQNAHLYDFDESLSIITGVSLSLFTSVRVWSRSLKSSQINNVNRSDIEVVDIQFSDSYATYVGPNDVYEKNAKAKILVKNVGQNQVDSVRLNHSVGPINCGNFVTGNYFPNLNLAPGDSIWIDYGWLGIKISPAWSDSILRTYCVYSSNPNGIFDLNDHNDLICKTVYFGMVDLEEKEKIDFKLHPNPSNDFVRIDVPNGFDGNYIIYDNTGKLVLKDKVVSTNIELTQLQSGVYFVRLFENNGKSSLPKKLVKK